MVLQPVVKAPPHKPTNREPHQLPVLLQPHFIAVHNGAVQWRWRDLSHSRFELNRGWYVLVRPSKQHNPPRFQFMSARTTAPARTTARGRVDYTSKWLSPEEACATWARCLLEGRCVWEPEE